MDIISYGTASKAASTYKKINVDMGEEQAIGSESTVKKRIEKISENINKAYKKANEIIIQNAINIAKAELKLNTIVKANKYEMNKMVIDDLYDTSGIDLTNSSNYTVDLTNGTLKAGENCIIQFVPLTANKIEELIFTVAYESYSQNSGNNLALGKSSSGPGSSSYITDGNKNYNYYSSASGATYVTVDLGEVYLLDEVRVYYYYGDSRTYYGTKLYYSVDNVNWGEINMGDFRTSPTSPYQTISLGGVEARYIKSYTGGNSQNYYSHWVEIEAYGEEKENFCELEYSIDNETWYEASVEDLTNIKVNEGTIYLRMKVKKNTTITGYSYVYN